MPSSCAVADCPNLSNKTKSDSAIIYHAFPKDKCIRAAWVAKCKRKDKINGQFARVCSEHFTREDYVRDLENELLGLPLRRKLKPEAIPSVFPLRSVPNPKVRNNDRIIRNHRKAVVQDLIG